MRNFNMSPDQLPVNLIAVWQGGRDLRQRWPAVVVSGYRLLPATTSYPEQHTGHLLYKSNRTAGGGDSSMRQENKQ